MGAPGAADLLRAVDLEEDKAARAVVVGLLAEMERKERRAPEGGATLLDGPDTLLALESQVAQHTEADTVDLG